jgi:predicted nucleic acid-binding Zn ribbon protein
MQENPKGPDDSDLDDSDLDNADIDDNDLDQDNVDDSPADTEPCPFCGKPVYEDAEVCPKCGQYISQEASSPKKPLWIILTVGVCVAVILIVWVLLRM